MPQSKKWRDAIGLLDAGASLWAVAEAAARASGADLRRAPDDPSFQFVTQLLVRLPLIARAPGFEAGMAELGHDGADLNSVTELLSGLNAAISRQAFEVGTSSDAGELARAALLETLSVQLRGQLPSLFEPTPQGIRKALAGFASGQQFAILAREFFARLTCRSLDYYLTCLAHDLTAPARPRTRHPPRTTSVGGAGGA